MTRKTRTHATRRRRGIVHGGILLHLLINKSTQGVRSTFFYCSQFAPLEWAEHFLTVLYYRTTGNYRLVWAGWCNL